MRRKSAVDLWAEVARVLGGSPAALSLAADPGLLAGLLPFACGRGPGDWLASMPSRFDAFREHLQRILLPGHPDLLRVLYLGDYSLRRMTAGVELVRGFRLVSRDGKKVQLPRGTRGALAHGKPDPAEDLDDLAIGLGAGQVAIFMEPFVPRAVLLAARAVPGSIWWPACPRTGPRPSRRKPAGTSPA